MQEMEEHRCRGGTDMKKFIRKKTGAEHSVRTATRGKKSRKKLYIIVSAAAAAAVTGGVLYSNGKRTQIMAADSSGQNVQETTAATGTVTNSITGTGTLASVEGDAVTIPSGLTIEEVNVSAGDTVSAGDVLATVDHSSVISAMSSVQSEIDAVDEQIAAITDDTETDDVTAGVSGTVTAVYAEEGTSVMDTMQASGALVEIAVDGDTDNIVQVTATDGTVSEIDVAVGDTVDTGDTLLTVDIDSTSEEYADLMSQRSELTSELQELAKIAETDEITATEDGTIAAVNVSASSSGSSSSASGTSGTQGSATGVASSYETVTELSDSGESTATGVTASAVLTSTENEQTADAVSASTISFTIAAASTGQDASNAFVLTAPATGASPVTELRAADGSWTVSVVWTDSSGNELSSSDTYKSGTTYRAGVTVTPADGYSLDVSSIASVSGYTVSGVTVHDDGTMTFVLTAPATAADSSAGNTGTSGTNASKAGSGSTGSGSGSASSSTDSSESSTSGTTSQGTNESSAGTQDGASSGTSGTGSASGNGTSNSASGITGSVSSGTGGTSSATTSSATTSSSDSTSDSTDTSTDTTGSSSSSSSEVTAFTMQSDDTMSISVSVDEQDINSVSVGQSATVTLDALDGVTLDGTVTAVSNSASSSGNGSAKYTVSISVLKQDGMLIGMSASATIVVDEAEDVVTIPVDALQEKGSETYVYTTVDDDGTLSGETEVETGLSDGDTVEITDGLSDGDTIYYQKTGNTSSSGNSDGQGGMPSGDMPSGDMPSGGNIGGDQQSGGQPSGGGPSGGMPSVAMQ